MVKKGLFIVFEGIDGAGTSSQLIKLVKHVEDRNKYQDVLRTHEPWNNEEIKKRLREEKDAYSHVKTMSKLFINDRMLHSFNLIEPNIKLGVLVLCDRYSMSTCAYQTAQGADLDELIKDHKTRPILIPNYTFFFDVSADIAQERILKRNCAKEKFEVLEFQRKVVENYRSLAKTTNSEYGIFGEVIKIDAERSISEVTEQINTEFDRIYFPYMAKRQL